MVARIWFKGFAFLKVQCTRSKARHVRLSPLAFLLDNLLTKEIFQAITLQVHLDILFVVVPTRYCKAEGLPAC